MSNDIDRSMLFKHAIDPWLHSRRPFISPRTYREYHYCKKPLLEFFGDMRLEDINAGKIRQYQTRRLQKCGAPSINHECCVVQQVLKRVGVWKNVVDDYQQLPLRDLGPGKSITEQEEEAWFAAAAIKPGWRVAYLASLISINTSAGPSELLHIKLENLRLETDPPEIQIVNGTKNKYRIRHVPLNAKAKWAVEQLLRRAKSVGAADPDHYLIPFRVKGKTESATYDPGRPATSWRSSHIEICATVGLRFRQYDFRHTAITRMLEAGVPEGTIMAICGHISRAMLERYSHIRMKSKLAAVQTILGRDQLATKKAERKTYLRIMINCPVSGKLVHTGMATEEAAFRSDQASHASSFTCPECHQIHSWEKRDAFLLP